MSYEPLERGLPPMHPGGLLREDVLPALGIPLSCVADALGVSGRTLRKILREEAAVTPDLALRLGKLCGNDPNLWVNLQARYDLARLLRYRPRNRGRAGRVPRSTPR
jgi:addiction module HigA family antidote